MNSDLDELRAHLSKPSDRIPSTVRRLGNALWNPELDPLTHQACIEALLEYIFSEVQGEPVTLLFPLVKQHLDQCDECGTEYAELLDLALAEQRGTLPEADSIPRPDLWFLPARESSLEQLILDWTRTILTEVAPNAVRELNTVAETFFVQMRPRQAAEARSTYHYSYAMDGESSSPARNILTASFATTQTLIVQVSRAQYDAWSNAGELQANLEARASSMARQLGIQRETSTRFAELYAQEVAGDPAALRGFLSEE